MMRTPLIGIGLAALAVGALAGCGGGDSSSGADVATADLVITDPGGLKFDKTEYTVAAKAGGVVIAQVNKDNQTHTLLLKEGSKQGPRVGPKLTDGPGDSSTGTYEVKAGVYYVYCDVPGHEASMNAKLTVT
ncbi:MAG: plastocyanin/azurin family copper-binding protein [Acidimicrobiales bacterium]